MTAERAKRFPHPGGVAVRKLIMWDSGERHDTPNEPTVTWGAGVPPTAEPAGSVYIREDGDAETTLYRCTDGEWAPLVVVTPPVSLTPSPEVGNVIDVAVQGPALVAQYKATVYQPTMVVALVAEFTLAENGAGGEASTADQPTLLFTTDANGQATISVTDVLAIADQDVFVEVVPAPAPGGVLGGGPAIVSIHFDGL